MNKVLFAIDEAYPFYKIGGLGDIGGSLPQALNQFDQDVRLILPFHPEVKLSQEKEQVFEALLAYDNQDLPIRVWQTRRKADSRPVYLVQEARYISEHTDASDNHADKFAVFSGAVALFALNYPGWQPDIVHCHDWHTALVSRLLNRFNPDHNLKTIMTIHNLAYQGRTGTPILQKLGYAEEEANQLQSELTKEQPWNIIELGLTAVDVITAVSQQYAREICTKEYGEDLESVLSDRQDSLLGILNGLDLETFNPAKDPHLYQRYDVTNFAEAKSINRAKLLEDLDMVDKPYLFGFVGRVDAHQKGIQLIIEAIEAGKFPNQEINFVFLGTGDPELEKQLKQLPQQDNIYLALEYNEQLASRIYSAADFMLIPSKFEPCGLVQMIAMRYGGLPIARKTGGLADTILDKQDGFLFNEYTTEALTKTIDRALTWCQDSGRKHQMIRQAMLKDFSWNQSALEYVKLYQSLNSAPEV